MTVISTTGQHSCRLVLGLVLFVITVSGAFANGTSQGICDESLVPSDDRILGYRERGGGTRCEGTYDPRVGSSALELVSCTSGAITYDLDPETTITASIRDRTGLTGQELRIP